MNKKHLCFSALIVLFIILFLSGYLQKLAKSENKGEIIDRDKHFEITAPIDKRRDKTYHYLIYNRDGRIVKKGDHYGSPPDIRYIDENTLKILCSAGISTYYCTYYDIANDRFSKTYSSPLATGYRKIVCFESDKESSKLIVSDIFDESSYYKEFLFNDMADVLSPVMEIKFIDKANLYVKYNTNEMNKEKSILLNLEETEKLTEPEAAKALFNDIYGKDGDEYFESSVIKNLVFPELGGGDPTPTYEFVILPRDDEMRMVRRIASLGLSGDESHYIYDVYFSYYSYDNNDKDTKVFSHSNYAGAFAVNRMTGKIISRREKDEDGLWVYNEDFPW